MLDFLKRKNRPSQPPPMTTGQGRRAAANLHELLMGAGCLAANIASMGQDLSIKVVEGDISEADLAGVLNVLHNANEDMERACKQISKVRETLALVANGAAHGGH